MSTTLPTIGALDAGAVPGAEDQSDSGFTRRTFLAGTAATAGAAAVVTMGTRYAFASPEAPGNGDVMVLVFLRGGADGLSLVAPYNMATYRTLRPTIRVKAPDEFIDPTGKAGLPMVQGGSIPNFALSGTFAMHPGMASLHAGPWTNGNLAIVHAAGMPAAEETRSHFDGQKNFEFGTASWNYSTGFLNRYLAGQPGVDRLAAVGRGGQLQRSLSGGVAAYSMYNNTSFNVSGYSSNTRARTALTSWYDAGTGDLLNQTGANTMAAIGTLAGINFASPTFAPQNGTVYPNSGFANDLKEIAQLIRANVGLRCVAVDIGGWDSHDGMGAPEDPASSFRQRAAEFADALSAFYNDLGTQMNEVTLATISEFGRTINENGSGGTDHGWGSSMFVMGKKIRGGVYGAFPTSIVDDPQHGDLTVMNDYRRVLSEVLSVRGDASNLSTIFPTFTQQSALGLALA